uniref:Uncharacterized protein n=1 Tax=Panagrolaimus superbus TaxID=310955 RepID=A0A914YCH6_9BILA
MDAGAQMPHAGGGMQRWARLCIDVAAIRCQALDDGLDHVAVLVMVLVRGQQRLRGALVLGGIGTAACGPGQRMRQQLRAALAQQQFRCCADQPGRCLPSSTGSGTA